MLLLSQGQRLSANSYGFSSTRNQARNTSWALLAPARRFGKIQTVTTCPPSQVHARINSSPLLYLLTPEPSYECVVYIRPSQWPLTSTPPPPPSAEAESSEKDTTFSSGRPRKPSASMDAVRGNRTFEDFDPAFEWSRAAEADAVKILLPGFKREEIRVLVDNHGHLRTHGARAVPGGRSSRFQKDFKLPDNCNVDGIRAKFESETLTITLPKKSPSPPQQVTAGPVPAPALPRPEPRRPAAAPQQKPPPAVPEPARPTVPAAPLVPAPSTQRLPPAPSQKKPAERRPSSLPSHLPSVPTPADVDEPPKRKPEPAAAVVPKLKEQVKETAKKSSFKEDEEKRMEREAMGKMEEDRKMVQEKEQEQRKEAEEAVAMAEMEMARRPRPMAAANRGLLVNVAVAVVVLVGITVYVWHTLRNATGDHGHGGMGAGSYGDEM